ncbi:hypothetical protein HZS_3162, partial [Henneguya salminicola]
MFLKNYVLLYISVINIFLLHWVVNLENCLVGNVKLVGITSDTLLDWRLQLLGLANSLAHCADLCCANFKCKASLLYNDQCYHVKCDDWQCRRTISKWPGPSPNLISGKYMEITRIKKRSIENQLLEETLSTSQLNNLTKRNKIQFPNKIIPTNKIEICNSSEQVFVNKMLKYGRRAAFFQSLGSKTFTDCGEKCCQNNCDAVLHLKNTCYHITCNSNQYDCEVGNNFEGKNIKQNESITKLIIFHKNNRRSKVTKRATLDEYISVKLNATNLRYDQSLENEDSIEFFQLASYVEDMISMKMKGNPVFIRCRIISFRNNNNKGVIISMNLILSQSPEEDMNAVKDILIPLISAVQIGKIGSIMNDAGLTLSQTSFEVSTSRGTSLICSSTNDYNIKWPVAIINTTVHVGCPKNARGMTERFCSENDYWQRPIFRKCFSKEYQDILKTVTYDQYKFTSAVDKLLQVISTDTLTESYSRRLKRDASESTDSNIFYDTSDVLSRVFGSLGDSTQTQPNNIDSNILSNTDIEKEYPTAMYSSSIDKSKNIEASKPIVIEEIKEYSFPKSSQPAEYKVFSTENVNLNHDSWYYGVMGGDIVTTIQILEIISSSDSTLTNIVVKELLKIINLLMSSVNMNEWLYINAKAEDELIFLKLIVSSADLVSKVIQSNMEDVVPISYNILSIKKSSQETNQNSVKIFEKVQGQIALHIDRNLTEIPLLVMIKNINSYLPKINFIPKLDSIWSKYSFSDLPYIVIHPYDKMAITDYIFAIPLHLVINNQNMNENNFECYTLDRRYNEFRLESCSVSYVDSYYLCKCNKPGPILYKFQGRSNISNKEKISSQNKIDGSEYTTESSSNFPIWAVLLLIILILNVNKTKVESTPISPPPSTDTSILDLNDEEKWVIFGRGDFITGGLKSYDPPTVNPTEEPIGGDISIDLLSLKLNKNLFKSDVNSYKNDLEPPETDISIFRNIKNEKSL